MRSLKRIKNCKFVDVAEAIRILKKGGVIAYPTETFFGLGADPQNKKAVQKIFKIKGRKKDQPISLIISSKQKLKEWVLSLEFWQKKFVDALWPGKVTLVFKANKKVNPWLTASTQTLGLRLSSHPVARRLAKGIGGAITATSANLSRQSPCFTCEKVADQIGKKVDGIVKSAPLKKSKGSTIVDISNIKIKLIREGDIAWKNILN